LTSSARHRVDGSTNNRVDKIVPPFARRAKTPAVSFTGHRLLFIPEMLPPRVSLALLPVARRIFLRDCCQSLRGAVSFPDYRRLAPTVASSESAVLRSSPSYYYERRFHLTVTPSHPWCDRWTCAQDHSTTSTTSTEQSVRLSSHLLPTLFRLKLSA